MISTVFFSPQYSFHPHHQKYHVFHIRLVCSSTFPMFTSTHCACQQTVLLLRRIPAANECSWRITRNSKRTIRCKKPVAAYLSLMAKSHPPGPFSLSSVNHFFVAEKKNSAKPVSQTSVEFMHPVLLVNG